MRRLGLALVALLCLLVAGALLLRTSWAQDRLRALVVSQVNRYLTATLEIDQLSGSLLRGVVLNGVRLSQDGQTVVGIETVEVGYSIRELISGGTVIRRLTLTRPTVVAARQPDGRWNLASLVRRNPDTPASTGPRRPLRIGRLQVVGGQVTLRDPITIGAAHLPSTYAGLDADLAISLQPDGWTVDVARAAFVGTAPDLTIRGLAGAIGSDAAGWRFRDVRVETPRSALTVDGRTDRRQTPSTLDLTVASPRLAFQEWSGVLGGLRNIAVEAALDATLSGPPSALATAIALRSTGGDVKADVVLDSTVPGWHAKGDATVARLDLARWLNRPERPSDITGHVVLDVDLQLGGHFPVGTFAFDGSHTGYLEYEADDVSVRGVLAPTEVQIARATATAYGANVRLHDSTMTIDAPYAFRFRGAAAGVDLRQMPASVPVPHVASTLAFDYDVTGQFAEPYLTGQAAFSDSEFLGATVAAGATGSIDTQVDPFHYAGEGTLSNVDLNRFGRDLQMAWLAEPRYAGMLAGQFHVDGTGADPATMALTGGGRLTRATLFAGTLSDADVTVHIANGTLDGTYDGVLDQIDPSIPMQDPLYAARLSGQARARFVVPELMLRSPELTDYTIDATFSARDSIVRDVQIARGDVEATMADGTMRIARLVTSGPGVDLQASGVLELDGVRSSSLTYDITRADLAQLQALLGREMRGQLVTAGQLTGPTGKPHVVGHGTVTGLDVSGSQARVVEGDYDLVLPTDDLTTAVGNLTARLDGVTASGQAIASLEGRASYDAGRVTTTVKGTIREGLPVSLSSGFLLDLAGRTATIDALTLDVPRTRWQLATDRPATVAWTDSGLRIAALDLRDASGTQQASVSGTWESAGGGQLRVALDGIRLESVLFDETMAARYGGVLQATSIVSGTAEHPTVSSDFRLTAGRVRRLPYEAFGGHVEYREGQPLTLDVRLDQAPGVWLTAAGNVPLSAFDRTRPAQPVRLAVKSSDVSLALLEGVSDVVRNVGGQMRLDVTVLGTTGDPHFTGRVDLTNASFDVVASGARYRNGRLAVQLASDRVTVETFRIEDEDGRPLEVTGSLGTHELRVGDLQVAVNARGFQVLRNEYGRVNIDAQLNLAGEFESPKLTGRMTVTGGAVNVDRILDRALFQPYSTQAAIPVELDPIVALNPWQRLGLDLELHVPGTLRMIGENVQVSPGTPLGLGNINLRAFGDLYLYKDPAQPMYVNGSFDSVSGTYVFQGRRFDLDPSSSINFRGDLNPELYVTVNRTISGVETRVSILGPLAQPELRLASTPPLDPSDILSLIVFNTSTNELSALQQQQLAVRAGTLAAGFIAAPMVSALERTLGIDTLEIEPGADIRGGPRVTVGNEIAPGLVARFSRQFGEADYDEATLEYYLSRLLRIRATFSDAGTLSARSPFRRVERAGIDLLLFFSF